MARTADWSDFIDSVAARPVVYPPKTIDALISLYRLDWKLAEVEV